MCRWLLPCLAFVSFASCDKSVAGSDDCLEDGKLTRVTFKLAVNPEMTPYKSLTRSGEATQLRYVVNLYDKGANTPSFHFVTSKANFTAELPVGKFDVVAWADYVPDGAAGDFYFFTDDFREILLRDKFGWHGNDPYKMAYSATDELTVTYRNETRSMILKPQMATIRILSNDTPDFEVGQVKVYYNSNVPSAMDAFTGLVSYDWSGVSYSHGPLGHMVTEDNVFADTEEREVQMRVEVYDREGNLKACRQNINVPFVKGGVTTVTADRLYGSHDNPENPNTSLEGGPGIDPAYDDTVIIYM